VTEYLLVNVAEQMKRLYSNVGTIQAALKQRPEVFHSVDVDATAHISFGFVHELMDETRVQIVVGDRCVGVNLGSVFHVVEHLALQGVALHVRYDLSANLAKIAVKDALHSSLT